MEGPTIYCQMGFLEQFIQKAAKSLDSIFFDANSSVDAISACFKLLYGKSNINIDAAPETLIAHTHPLVKKFIKNPTANIQCNTKMDEHLAEDEFWLNTTTEIFMLDKSEKEAARLEADWGMMVLIVKTLKNKERFLNPSPPIFINQNQDGFKWDTLAFARHHFHSILIIDNYLNSNEKELQENIIPLILNLCQGVPRKRKLNLSLITTADNIKGIHDKLQKLLDQNNIKADLSVSKTQILNNHDRHCITNQLWISSGFGFNLLSYNRSKGKMLPARDTTIFTMPRVSNDQLDSTTEIETPHTGTYFSASQAIIHKMNILIENSKLLRGTQSWHISTEFYTPHS